MKLVTMVRKRRGPSFLRYLARKTESENKITYNVLGEESIPEKGCQDS